MLIVSGGVDPAHSLPLSAMDWHAWHRDYEGDTPLARRLVVVQGRIRDLISESRAPLIRVISMCAGDGRDIVGALAGHSAASRVRGRLVEVDPDLAATARASAAESRLALDVVEADAGWTDAYTNAAPADLLLACGVFGHCRHHCFIVSAPGTVRPDGARARPRRD